MKVLLFFFRKYSQRKTMLKSIMIVSRCRKTRCMPCGDFCFIWSRGVGNVVHDMRHCDCGTSISCTLILSFYYCIQPWSQMIPFSLLHNSGHLFKSLSIFSLNTRNFTSFWGVYRFWIFFGLRHVRVTWQFIMFWWYVRWICKGEAISLVISSWEGSSSSGDLEIISSSWNISLVWLACSGRRESLQMTTCLFGSQLISS